MKVLIFILIMLLMLSCSSEKNEAELADLQCEYLVNPLGIDVLNPRLSWIMESERYGAAQSAYRIIAATSEMLLETEKPDLWDSGKVDSGKSIQIEYAGNLLQSGMKVFWKVRVWDENGKVLPWSETAVWEMGLLNENDWKAKWIGSQDVNLKEWKLPAPMFRNEIDLQGKIKRARVYISGLGYYELYLNGEKVGDHVLSPNQTNYDKQKVEKWNEARVGNMSTTVLYETFDITSNLKSGKNALGVMLGNGWYIQADRPGDSMLWYNTPRFMAQFEIEFEDGNRQTIVTDETWKTDRSALIYNGLHSGEIYDARLEQPGWNYIGFNDSAWEHVVEVTPPSGKIKAQMSAPDRVIQTIRPVKITETDRKEYFYDLGKMISGWVKLRIEGSSGDTIKLRYFEEPGKSYGQTDTYILNGNDVEIWEPRFTWHAFRYVEVSGSKSELKIENIEGQVVNTDVRQSGNFICSDTLLNQIQKIYKATQLGNLHGGIPSDCPHRERRGYTGDGQISAKSAIYSFNMAAFYTKWLNDIGDAQNHQTGYVPNTAPYQDGGGGTAWGAAYVIIPWYLYQYYGDVRILQEHYNGMKHWVEYMNNSLDKNGILANQGLGEWVPPDVVEIPEDFVNTCYYYHCCRLMGKISHVLDKSGEAGFYENLASNAADVIYKNWFDKSGPNFSIGRQGANELALGLEIARQQDKQSVFQNLVENVMKNKIHFDTGILATPLLLEILTENGRADLAHTLMSQRDFPSFGHMIENDATTIWETWQGDMSHSHPMFGSVTAWFYQYLAGISPVDKYPGFKQFQIKPFPVASLGFVEAVYPCPYGRIESGWEWNDDDFQLTVKIPANTSAIVHVLALNENSVTANGKPVEQNPYIRMIKMEGQNAVYEVSSGKFVFHSKGAKTLMQKPFLPAPVIYPGNVLAEEGDSVEIRISAGVSGAEIHYTINGGEPDENATVYTSPFYIKNPAAITAKSFADNYNESFPKTAVINFVNPDINGLKFDYYEGIWTKLPNFSGLNSRKSGSVYQFDLSGIHPKKDEFAVRFEGMIKIEKEGDYTFYLISNDGSCLYVNNRLVVNHDGLHGADQEKTGKIFLQKGIFPIHLQYFQAGGGMFLKVQFAGPDIEKQEIPATILFKND